DDVVHAVGGVRGVMRELAHFVGDDGKTAALFAGACGFDRSVQGEQIYLFGDIGNHVDHGDDILELILETANGAGQFILAVIDGLDLMQYGATFVLAVDRKSVG